MTYQEAIEILKPIVGNSNINNQPFIDFDRGLASDRDDYQVAMMIIRQEVALGHVTEEEVKSVLGLMV